MTPRPKDYRDTPGFYAYQGAAAAVLAAAYAPGTRPGRRADMARAARHGATTAARLRIAAAGGGHGHAPPYPVPVAHWRGRAW